jgi:hypothetical protein
MLGLCKCFILQHYNSCSHNDRFQSHITAWLPVFKEDTSCLEIHFYSFHSTSINYTPIHPCNKTIHLSKNGTKTCYNFVVEYMHFSNVRPHFHGSFSLTAAVDNKKVKLSLHTSWRNIMGLEVHLHSLLTSATDRDVWLAPRRGTFTNGKSSPGIH